MTTLGINAAGCRALTARKPVIAFIKTRLFPRYRASRNQARYARAGGARSDQCQDFLEQIRSFDEQIFSFTIL
jgi:hypothetical protein